MRVSFVADEVVVDKEHTASPTEVVERVELREHLLVALRARHAAKELRDVAELTVERAAAGELGSHRVVGVHVQEVVTRHWSVAYVGLGWRVVVSLRLACGPVGEEVSEGVLHLTHDEVVDVVQLVAKGCRVRAARDDGGSSFAAPFRDLDKRLLLDDHRRGEYGVRPLDIGVRQGFDVHIHEPEVVSLIGEHPGDGQEPQGGHHGLLVYEVKGVLVAPIGGGELRRDQEGVHLRHI